MKKIGFLVALLMSAAVISACSAGTEVDTSVLHGEWVYVKDDMTSTYVINADGTFSATSEASGEFAISMTYEGTYAYDGEELVFTYTDIGDSAYNVTVEGDKMTLDNGSSVRVYEKQ